MELFERFFNTDNMYIKRIGSGVLFLCVLSLSFWMRIQGADTLPNGQFTGNDAYVFYSQAQTIAEHGQLPAKDMHRWMPFGRDNGQLLSLYSYVIAYLHKLLSWLFPNLTLYQIQLYLPALCYTLGLGVLFLFLTRCYGGLFALISCVLLATVPGSVERSAIGFGDRDAWCWLLGMLSVISYLWKAQLPLGRNRWIATVLSGIVVFLGGLSWEAFGVFVLIIVVLEMWKFCTTTSEQQLHEYILWIAIFVPLLYILAPIYRRGTGYATHAAALMLLPPLVILAIRGARYLLLKYVNAFSNHPRKIAWGLAFLTLGAGVLYFWLQYDAFETTAFAFRENPLMKNMGELVDPSFIYWTDRYGAVFVLGSIGIILASSHFGTPHGTFLGISLLLFTGTTFFRKLLDNWVGTQSCDILFFIAIGLTILAFAIIALRKTDTQSAVDVPAVANKHTQHHLILVAMSAWFLLWVALSRGGKRYDFFIGLPLVFGTASLLWIAPAFFKQTVSALKQKLITTCAAIAILIAILFLSPLGGHLTRLYRTNFNMRAAVPGEGPMFAALHWINETLPSDSVIAASWTYGMPLNVIGNVKTITDSDTYIPHWIHLYYRYLFCARSEREALAFLKTHQATHLLLTEEGVTVRAHTNSLIGSNENGDRQFGFYPLHRVEMPIGSTYRMVSVHPEIPLTFVDFDKTTEQTLTLTLRYRDGKTEKILIPNPTTRKMVSVKDGGLALYFDRNAHLLNAYYIPAVGWNSFAVKIFLRAEHSDVFVPVYPTDSTGTSKIKIWAVRYPSEIQIDQKYLDTAPQKSP